VKGPLLLPEKTLWRGIPPSGSTSQSTIRNPAKAMQALFIPSALSALSH
jgi:hypothetical protein